MSRVQRIKRLQTIHPRGGWQNIDLMLDLLKRPICRRIKRHGRRNDGTA